MLAVPTAGRSRFPYGGTVRRGDRAAGQDPLRAAAPVRAVRRVPWWGEWPPVVCRKVRRAGCRAVGFRAGRGWGG
ncbi:hypothetical protein GCM10010440_38040 [Kitasatospora cinereorecta]